tara:strand:+ start:436 stop:1074 length:639 start_codon:yes stop_codon:yes gene_type:complete
MNFLDKGQSGLIYLNSYRNNISKCFKDKQKYFHEKHILLILKEKKICNHAEIVSYDDNKKIIITKYIPHNLERLCADEINLKKLKSIDRDLLIYNILIILDSLHKYEICHCDFKAKNLQLNESHEPYIIDFDTSVVEFNDYEDLYKLMCEDLHKMKLLIIQLINIINYKSSYIQYETHIKKIKKKSPVLHKLLISKDYNIKELVEYFMIKCD